MVTKNNADRIFLTLDANRNFRIFKTVDNGISQKVIKNTLEFDRVTLKDYINSGAKIAVQIFFH